MLISVSILGGVRSARDDELCKIIISDMNTYGLAVIDDFLGSTHGLEILREVDHMYGAGVFQVKQSTPTNGSLSLSLKLDA